MPVSTRVPNATSRFGPFGGRYVPETLTHALEELAAEILREVPGIVSVTYNIAPKPPSTIEAV